MMLYNIRHHQRQKRRKRILKFLLLVMLISGSGLYGYKYAEGTIKSGEKVLKVDITRLKGKIDDSQDSLSREKAQTTRLINQLAKLNRRYEQNIPVGWEQDLLNLLRDKHDKGIKPDRLISVIQAITPGPRQCTEATSKRFMIKTRFSSSGANFARFDSGALTVSGYGEFSRDHNGNPEAWFNPAEPVEINIKHLGGKTTTLNGKLPLSSNLVVGDKEYRIQANAGQRSFVEVAVDRCVFP